MAHQRWLKCLGSTCLGCVALICACQDGKFSSQNVSQPLNGGEGSDGIDDAWSVRVPNSLKTEYFLNALIANVDSLTALTSSTLSSASFAEGGNPDLRRPLHDPFARNFMRYLVGCALNPGDEFVWNDPYSPFTQYRWVGDAGRCPEWNSGLPTLECLHRVSACLFARNNKFGIPVELSMRGANLGPFPTVDPPVTVTEDIDRMFHMPVPSFASCPSPESGLGRNCGWIPNFAGKCTPGERIYLGAGGIPNDPTCGGCTSCPSLGTSDTGRLIIRVCDEIDGCDSTNPRYLTSDDGACTGAPTFAPAVGFTCPTSGFFSAMIGPYNSDEIAAGTVQANDAAIFPVSQLIAYTIREGAYYGSVIDVAGLDSAVNVRIEEATGEVTGRDVALAQPHAFHLAWTCFDRAWNFGLAYAFHRVCALPNPSDPSMSSGCVAHVTGCCNSPSSDPSVPVDRCLYDRRGLMFPNYDDFEKCLGDDPPETISREPITVFLHGACDVPGQDQPPSLCSRHDG